MEAYIIDGIRTPIGSYQGTLAAVRADDLGALVIKTVTDNNARMEKRIFFIGFDFVTRMILAAKIKIGLILLKKMVQNSHSMGWNGIN